MISKYIISSGFKFFIYSYIKQDLFYIINKRKTNLEDKKEKVIEIGFNNETIQSCIDFEKIFEALEKPSVKENLDKCLNSGSKLFSH